jgi:hypothetical protein
VPIGAAGAGVAAGAISVAPLISPSTPVKAEVPVDHLTVPLQSLPAVAGVMQVVLDPPPVGFVYKVERIGISVVGSVNPTTATVYVDSVSPQNQADYSSNGNQDQADEQNPILVPGGKALIIVWSGASNGAMGFARIQLTLAVVVRGTVPGAN